MALCIGKMHGAELHTFTDAQGRLLKGELVSILGDQVTIKREDGQVFTVKATIFSQADQDWLKQRGLAKDAASPPPDEVERTWTAKSFTMDLVDVSEAPKWSSVASSKSAVSKRMRGRIDDPTPDDILLAYKKSPAGQRGEGIFIHSLYYPFWDHPENATIHGPNYDARLRDENYRHAEAEKIEILRKACELEGVPLYVNLEPNRGKHWRVLVSPKHGGAGLGR